MSAEKTEDGTTKGLAIIVAAVVAFAAIVGASAIVAKKPAPREDFLAGLPEERPRAPEAPAAAVEEDLPEEEPRPAELIARAEKLVADGSRDRGQIEGLLQAAVRARPGADESIRAFKLLLDLYEKWREEDSRSVPAARAELPRPPAPPPPVETPRGVVLYSEDFERGPGGWSGEAVRDASGGGGVLRLGPVPEDKYSLLRGLIQTLNLRGGPDTRISFRYRTEGGLSRVEAQFWLEDASGKGNNHYALLSPSRNWTSADLAFGRLAAKGEPIDLARGFRIANMQVFAGRRDEQGACYLDDFVVYNPAGIPRPAAPPPPRPAAPAAPPTPGFVSLIGTDLSGWGNPTGGTWKLEGGAILGDCLNVSGYLYTRKRFRDFTLKLRVTGLATSGYSPHFKVRFRWVPEKGKYGCQTDLTTKAYFYAAIVGDDKPEEQVFDVPTGSRPSVGTSVEVELVAIGESVTMLVNGREVYSATAKITEPGLLGICAHKSSILFERVEVKEH